MRGVQRTIAVFECFTHERPRLTLHEIWQGVGLPKSATFRVVQSLEEAGYLIRLEDQSYCLSFRFTRLAGMVMSTLSIRQVARPPMVELGRLTDETIALNTVNGRDRVCIESIDTASQLASLVRPGQSMKLDDRGAIHKTLMAYLPEKERDRLAGDLTKGNPRKRAEMLATLARLRKDGYSVTHSERVLGLTAIAAPIRDTNDTSNYVVAISGPTVRLESRIDEFVGLLLKCTGDISRRLGAPSPPAPGRPAPARTKKTSPRA